MPKTVIVDGVQHTFPDDATDAEIGAALEQMHPAQSPQPQQEIPAWKRALSAASDFILPTGGMILGGAGMGAAATPETLGVGTIPAAVVGGGMGYATGKGLSNQFKEYLGTYTPGTPMEELLKAGQDAGEGVGYEMLGGVVPKMFAPVGNWLKSAGRNTATRVLKPSTADNMTAQATNLNLTPAEVAAETTKRKRGIEAILQRGLMPTEKGMAAANQARHDTGQVMNALFKEGDTVDMAKVYEAMFAAGIKKLPSQAEGNVAEKEMVNYLANMEASHGISKPALDAHELKYTLQGASTYGTLDPSVTRAMNKAGAAEINSQLRATYPDYARLNSQYEKLKTAQKILEKSEARLGNNSNVVGRVARMGTGAALGGVAGNALGSPTHGAEIGFLLAPIVDNPTTKMLAARGMYNAGTGIENLLASPQIKNAKTLDQLLSGR